MGFGTARHDGVLVAQAVLSRRSAVGARARRPSWPRRRTEVVCPVIAAQLGPSCMKRQASFGAVASRVAPAV